MRGKALAVVALGALVVVALARRARARATAPAPVMTPPNSTGLRLTSEGLPALTLEIAESRLGQSDGAGYLAELGLGPENNWCAAGLTSWLREAAAYAGAAPPIAGSALSKELMRQLQRAGRWIPRELISAEDLTPGLVAVWHRGEPGAETGHAGLVARSLGVDSFESIDANSTGGAVARNVRRLDDPHLLGFGFLGEMPTGELIG
jgi:hypothetical protein